MNHEERGVSGTSPFTAIVTGGASGIGHRVALDLLARWSNSQCVVLDISTDEPQSVEDGRLLRIECDVSDEDSVDGALRSIDDGLPPIKYLVNCAAVLSVSPSMELSFAEWKRVLSVDLDGTFLMCQRVGRRMIDTGGSIVNLSSINAFFGRQQRLPYSVSKGGIGVLTRTLAVEWAQYGIRVNAVAPSYILTPLLTKVIDSGQVDRSEVAALHPMNRLGEPKEVSSVILFLLSDEASFVTGETVMVDGGFSVHKWVERPDQ
jgi:NAD(P)-dependent dehydrogenase (short-subunit alcohol dehydrogenase family)